jgi:maleate isomerase
MHSVYGWRGTIGIMTPGTSQQVEFHRKVPDGIAICTTLLPLKSANKEGLIEMSNYIETSADLLAQQRVDIIMFVCTTGSLIKGIGYDQDIIKQIEKRTNIPAITTTTSVLEAFKALDIKKIFVVTPYIDELNIAEKDFLEKSGITVLSIKGLGIGDQSIQDVNPSVIYRLVKEQFDPKADAVFISCTGLCVFDIIEPLEIDLQIPVITSVQASLWHGLRKINVLQKINDLGRLFRI